MDGIPLPPPRERFLRTNHNIQPNMLSCDQLATLIRDPVSNNYDRILILDARFQYEFKGGHILGAKNITNRDHIRNIFNICSGQNTCVVCYCDSSQSRGPILYQFIREFDREQHAQEYPILTIPNLYVLDQGYRSFYDNYPELCVGGFTEIRDPEFIGNGDYVRSIRFYRNNMRSNIF